MIGGMTTRAAKTAVGTVGTVDTQFLDLPKPIGLDCGRALHPIRVAYETYGTLSPARDNVILVCHALSGDAHAAGFTREPVTESTRDGFRADERDAGKARGLGWWDGMIGPGKAFDTDRFFVVSTNLLGGCRGTTGPSSLNPATGRPYGSDFPVITVADMVRTERAVLDELGITRLAAVAGGSLGGMQALEWAVRYGDQVDAIIPIASTHALQPQGVAWNAIARNAIMTDPDWQGGRYFEQGLRPAKGLAVARMAAHITYLSEAALQRKFGRELQRDGLSWGFDADFQVESYLRHQGASFVDRFDANSYLYITRAMDYFDLAAKHGGALTEAFAQARGVKFCVLSFSSDWLYPTPESRDVVRALNAAGCRASFAEIESDKGHDAFLLDEPQLDATLRGFLSAQAQARGLA